LKDTNNANAGNSGQKVKVGRHVLNLTHLNKVYFPKQGYTKGDLISYYQEMATLILPYLKDRPENLLRHPNGIAAEGFFHKDMGTSLLPSWIETARIWSDSNKKYMHYLVCNDLATLLYMVNLGCIEINPWNSRVHKLDKPDWIGMDLDPEGVGFDKVITVAQTINEILQELEITGYPKTSGKTGIHIYLPMAARYTYEQSKQLAEIIATMTNERLPRITSIERHPAKRRHRVYVDYLQNNKGQTLAAPYSLRPVDGAHVSTPLEWSEIRKGLDPSDFNIKNIGKRVERKGDLFQKVLGKGVDIEKVLRKLDKGKK